MEHGVALEGPWHPVGAGARPSDADRDRVADLLASSFAAGRLDGVEHRRRIEVALRATTLAELAELTADLPGGAPVPPPYGHPPPWYPPPGYVRRPTPPIDGLAVTSLVLVLMAPITWFLFGTPMLAALAFGHVALARSGRYARDSRRIAIAGLVIAYIELALALALIVIVFIAHPSP